MIRRKRIAVLGVSMLAALGLMSVSAVGAQAGQWTINGKALGAPGYAPFQSKGGPITISSSGVDFACPEMISGGNLLTSGLGTAYVSLVDCTVAGSEVCDIGPKYTDLKADLRLNADGSELTFENVSGSLTIVSVEEECALIEGESLSVKLSGKITANAGADAVQLPLTFLGAKDNLSMDWGGGKAEVKGKASMWLTGANVGKLLGAS